MTGERFVLASAMVPGTRALETSADLALSRWSAVESAASGAIPATNRLNSPKKARTRRIVFHYFTLFEG
jgi:hypothetical protein